MHSRFLALLLLTSSLIHAEQNVAPLTQEEPKKEEEEINKLHILYLMQAKEVNKSIDLYRRYQAQLGRHDFEILQQMALIILDQGARSADPEQQLISIFGSGIAGIAASVDILEAGITSPNPETQMASIQYLGHIQDDRSEELLTKAMASDFFFTRMEAANQLAMRKSRSAVGQIESLMYRVPQQARFFFPQFFASIGTSDAIALLRHMMDEPFHMTRIEAILSAARFGRDDLLPSIRARSTHLHVAEQEACATAMGGLKDSKSIPLLKKLSTSSSDNVKIAALRSRYLLGDESVKEDLLDLAKKENLFAINALADIAGSEDLLVSLTKSENIQLRFNAAFALVSRRDPRVTSALYEFLIRDSRDLSFHPQYSVGNSLISWKVVPSAAQHQKDGTYDFVGLSLNVREHLLRLCLELPNEEFLKVARAIFDSRQTELVPLLTALFENEQNPEMIRLLEKKAQTAGAPLVRAYCNLSLLRLKQKGSYEQSVLSWINSKRNTEMIRFRPTTPWNVHMPDKASGFELTPEENSRLLIECYRTISQQHTEKSIEILLDGLKSGHYKNRSVLAGLLIQALQ